MAQPPKSAKESKSPEAVSPRESVLRTPSFRASKILKGHSGISMLRKTSVTGGGKQTLKYGPTYRLESKNPVHRETVENIIKKVMDNALSEFSYNPKAAQSMCKHISEEIKTRVKFENYDRFKLVCIVTIGEKFLQDYTSVATFLWEPENDGYLTHTVDTPKYFAVATLYYLYYN